MTVPTLNCAIFVVGQFEMVLTIACIGPNEIGADLGAASSVVTFVYIYENYNQKLPGIEYITINWSRNCTLHSTIPAAPVKWPN